MKAGGERGREARYESVFENLEKIFRRVTGFSIRNCFGELEPGFRQEREGRVEVGLSDAVEQNEGRYGAFPGHVEIRIGSQEALAQLRILEPVQCWVLSDVAKGNNCCLTA